jgi:hypothetical protein
MVVNACNLSYSGCEGRKISSSRPVWAKLVRPYLKNKRAEVVSQVVEHSEALGSNPTIKNKKQNKKSSVLF